MSRHILAFVETHPILSATATAGTGAWSVVEMWMQRGTTVLGFATAAGGFVLLCFNLVAAWRKRRVKRRVRCNHCHHFREIEAP